MLFLRSDRQWGPPQLNPRVVAPGFRLLQDSNKSELAKYASDRARQSLIPVLKGSLPIEAMTIYCGRFPTG
ncbi:hypothetical protein [Microcoleus vaginatus]|uniref:hypothetical protein n=1 Tax=Microcoleus vaginatus TaxID=119532 RepID=UPI001F5FFB96|nr:hypothetical protein D0A37_22335 [Microcoleus vaginatus HSN003]